MRWIEAFNHLARMGPRLRDDAQTQVRVMAGMTVLLMLLGQVRSWRPAREGKDAARGGTVRLIVAGVHTPWTEEFGPARRGNHARPVLTLRSSAISFPQARGDAGIPSAVAGSASSGNRVPRATEAPCVSLNSREIMKAAASRSWDYLTAARRNEISGLFSSPAAPAPVSASPLTVRLHWSGDSRGHAALLAHRPPPGMDRSSRAAFVIGNGSRSDEGEIERLGSSGPSPANRDDSLSPAGVDIILIGRAGTACPAQLSALGELLNYLEAVSGSPLDLPESDSGSAATPGAPL